MSSVASDGNGNVESTFRNCTPERPGGDWKAILCCSSTKTAMCGERRRSSAVSPGANRIVVRDGNGKMRATQIAYGANTKCAKFAFVLAPGAQGRMRISRI